MHASASGDGQIRAELHNRAIGIGQAEHQQFAHVFADLAGLTASGKGWASITVPAWISTVGKSRVLIMGLFCEWLKQVKLVAGRAELAAVERDALAA